MDHGYHSVLVQYIQGATPLHIASSAMGSIYWVPTLNALWISEFKMCFFPQNLPPLPHPRNPFSVLSPHGAASVDSTGSLQQLPLVGAQSDLRGTRAGYLEGECYGR